MGCIVIHGKYYYNGHTRHKAVYTVNLYSHHPQWSKNALGGNTIAAPDPRVFSNYGQCHMQHMTEHSLIMASVTCTQLIR